MPRRTAARLLCLLLLLTLLPSCRSNDPFYIAYPVTENIRTLDPQVTASETAMLIDVNCFEGLVARGEDGTIVPAAAESWEKTGLTYTFHLRTDAKWMLSSAAKEGMTGKLEENFAPSVTADDFVFAFTRLADPAMGAPDAYRFASIQNFPQALEGVCPPTQIGVRALSENELTVTLTRDDPDFLENLLLPAAMPCNRAFFEACGGRYGLMTRYMLTNGPFYFSRWNVDQSFRISKSDVYTGTRKAAADSVWFYLNDDMTDMNRKLAEGVYTAGRTTLAAFPEERLDKAYTAEQANDTLLSLIFNCKRGATGVKSTRTALVSSLDRTLLTDTPASGMLPSSVRLPDGAAVDLPNADESAARASMKAALIELSADAVSLTVLCPTEYETALKNQMQQWQKTLGVSMNVTVRALPENDLLTAVQEGDFDAALYPLRASGSAPESFLSRFTSGHEGNVTGLASAEYDGLYRAVCTAADETARAQAIGNAIRYLVDNAVYCPLTESGSYFVQSNEVEGIYRAGSPELVYFERAKEK